MRSEVEQLQAQQVEQKKMIEAKNMALRLDRIPEFKKLVMDGFARDECIRLVSISADPNLSAADRADALAMAQAPGHLKRYLSAVVAMGIAAENQVESLDDALREAQLEEEELAATNNQDNSVVGAE